MENLESCRLAAIELSEAMIINNENEGTYKHTQYIFDDDVIGNMPDDTAIVVTVEMLPVNIVKKLMYWYESL